MSRTPPNERSPERPTVLPTDALRAPRKKLMPAPVSNALKTLKIKLAPKKKARR